MSEWPIVPLEQVLAPGGVTYGIVQPGQHDPTGVPIVRVSDMVGNTIRVTEPLRVSKDIESTYTRTRLDGGEVLVSIVGTVGRVAVATAELKAWNVARAIAVLRPAEPLDAEWLRYALLSPQVQSQMHIRKTDTVQATLNLRDVRNLDIPWPDPLVRQQIVSVLGALDALIEIDEALVRDLAALQLAVFRAIWDGESRAPLVDVAAITMGQSPPGETYNEIGEGTPFYQGIRDFGWRYPSRRVWTTEPTRLAGAGDILVAVRAPVGELNLATESTALGRGLAGLRADGRQSTLFQALQADPGLWDIHQGTGTVFASINKASMSNLSIPWVDNKSLEQTLADLDAAILDIFNELRDITSTRDELLPLLLSGKVRVSELEAVA